jgi:hypothetical protein
VPLADPAPPRGPNPCLLAFTFRRSRTSRCYALEQQVLKVVGGVGVGGAPRTERRCWRVRLSSPQPPAEWPVRSPATRAPRTSRSATAMWWSRGSPPDEPSRIQTSTLPPSAGWASRPASPLRSRTLVTASGPRSLPASAASPSRTVSHADKTVTRPCGGQRRGTVLLCARGRRGCCYGMTLHRPTRTTVIAAEGSGCHRLLFCTGELA